MKKIIYLLLYVFSIELLYAQDQSTYPTSGGFEKFNRRGVFNNDAVTKQNHEIISDYDGNLLLQYSTPMNLPNDLGGDFTIIYNANVEHRVYIDNTILSGQTYDIGTINLPEWIFGYKGIALQTLNFENFLFAVYPFDGRRLNYANGNWSGTNYRANYLREEPLIIPGYHLCNDISVELTVYNQIYQNITFLKWANYYDVIQILKADGSKITLRNKDQGLKTGVYVEQDISDYGYAIVNKLPSGLRQIYYFPGDGLTYYFEESPFLYIGCIPSTANQDDFPKSILLKYITNQQGNKISFEYITSHALLNLPSYPDVRDPMGRNLFNNITYTDNINSSSPSVTQQLSVNYSTSNLTITGITINNVNTSDNFTLTPYGLSNYFINVFGTYRGAPNDYSNSNVSNVAFNGKIIYPNIITNSLGQQDNVTYYPVGSVDNPDPSMLESTDLLRSYGLNSTPDYEAYFTERPFLPKSINYYSGKKVNFSYYPQRFISGDNMVNDIFYFPQCLGGTDQFNNNINKAYRNCFVNYMIRERDTWNSDNTTSNANVIENYQYTWLPGSQKYWDAEIDGITTIKTVTGNDGLGTINTKIFSKFNTSLFDPRTLEDYATTKLIQEETTSLNASNHIPSIKNVYDYDKGNSNSNGGQFIVNYYNPSVINFTYYQGSFFLQDIITNKTDINGNILSNLETKYSNVTNNINYSTVNIIEASDVINFTKIIKSNETITDPKGLLSLKTFYNYGIINQYISETNTNSFYKLGLINEEKIYSNNAIKSDKILTYYDGSTSNGTLVGKLLSIKNNTDPSRITTKSFSYYDNTSPNVGLLSSLQDVEKGVTATFNYVTNDNINNGISGILVSSLGISQPCMIKAFPAYPLKPFKTTTNYDSKTISSYSSYDNKVNLKWEIEANNYISTYDYDVLGRLTKARFPYSFTSFDPNSVSDYSTNYIYDDVNKTITGNSKIDFAGNNNYNFTEYYDGFGLLRKRTQGTAPEVKFTKDYNSLNLISDEIDGLGRRKNYQYDYLNRPTIINYGNNSLPQQSYNYYIGSGSFTNGGVTVNYVEYTVFTDENNKTTTTYYDNVGNKVGVLLGVYSPTNPPINIPTIFKYNDIYQLINIVTPEGKITTYVYDALGNLSEKDSPDEGAIYYKYDKYGELRYEYTLHKTTLNYVIAHRYDKLGRLISTAIRKDKYDKAGFDSLNADNDDPSDYLDSYLTLINIYDNINDISQYSNISNKVGNIPQDYINTQYNPTNTIGRLALAAYRDDPTVDKWNYKIYKYTPLGKEDKVLVHE